MSPRAFTLIELLVVIAVLAVLAAFLFPVFAEAKESAKKTDCLDNQKQIGAALYLYVQDSDDSLPMASYPSAYLGPPFSVFSWHAGAGKAELNWADLILPYAKDVHLFKCPGDDTGQATYPLESSTRVPGEPLSYALNYYLYRQPGDVNRMTLTGGGMSEIPAAASKIFLTESASGTGFELMRPDRWRASDGSSIFERHVGGANYVYADTHAQYQKMPQWWKDPTKTAWEVPEAAESYPSPQWFPWLETKTEGW